MGKKEEKKRQKVLKKAEKKLVREGYPEKTIFWLKQETGRGATPKLDFMAWKPTATGDTKKRYVKVISNRENFHRKKKVYEDWVDELREEVGVKVPEIELWGYVEPKTKPNHFKVYEIE